MSTVLIIIVFLIILLMIMLFIHKKTNKTQNVMRTCVIFRGENFREKRGLTSALDCVDNWKETILDVIDCDVVFFTYPSTILNDLINKLSPIHVSTGGYNCQDTNALAAIQWMVNHQHQYDRFLLLRFDVMYRKKVLDWHHWNKNGITLVNRDIHYPKLRLYHDIAFVVDHEWVDHFKKAFVADDQKFKICLHHIGRELEDMKDVPLYIMYLDHYHLTNHPFYALHPDEPRPNLNDDYQGKKVLDLSPWNKPEEVNKS